MATANGTASAAVAPRVYPGWLVVAAAFLGVMVSFGSLFVFTFSIFLKPLGAEFGWSRESISTGFGIGAITVALVSPGLGRLLDRFGARRIVLPSMLVFGLGFASLSRLTPSLAHFYLVTFLLGVVGNGSTQMGYSGAVSSWFTDRRGLALALVVAGSGTGSIVFPPVAQWLIDTEGWRTAYLVLGLLVLIVGLPLSLLYLRERPHTGGGSLQTAPGATVAEGLRTRAFWLLIGAEFLNSIAVNGAITHMAALLTDRGVEADSAALAVSLLGATSLTGRIFTGYLLDRFFGPRVSAILFAGVAAGILVLATAATPAAGLLAAALIGLGLGGEADIVPYLLTRYFGLRKFSTLYGFTWTAYAIAGGAGPILMGKVFDATHSYTWLLTLLSGVALGSAALMLVMPRYPKALESNR